MNDSTLSGALTCAEKIHSSQKWKNTEVAFLHHPLGVASLVLFYGGDLAQAQAALLHDARTDGLSAAEIIEKFGPEVGELVEAFQDPPAVQNASLEWSQIKKGYLDKLSTLPERALFTCICEELNELTTLNLELKHYEQEVWKRYPVPGRDLGWYFKSILSLSYHRLSDKKFERLNSELAHQTKILSQKVFEGVNS